MKFKLRSSGFWGLLLAVWAARPATPAEIGLGVMWRPTAHRSSTSRIERELRESGARWVRQTDDWPAAPGFRSVVWWPGDSRNADPARDLWPIFNEALHAPAAVASAAAVEVGNEPDLHFTQALPDQMAAVVKAACCGLKAARPDQSVLMPALAAEPGPYWELLAKNGLSRFTDAWNVHFYGWAQDFSSALGNHVRFRDRQGGRGLPLWVTELGLADFPPDLPEHEAFHRARQQAFLEQAAVRGFAAGAEQEWSFIAGACIADGCDYGLHDAGQNPRPAWASWLALARLLPVATLRFRLLDKASAAERGWVLELGEGARRRWWTVLVSPHRWQDIRMPNSNQGEFSRVTPAAPTTSIPVQLRFPPDAFPVRLGLAAVEEWSRREWETVVSSTNNLHLWSAPVRFEIAGCRWEAARRPAARDRPVQRRGEVVLTLRPVGPGVTRDKPAAAYRVAGCLPLSLEITAYNFGTNSAAGAWKLALPPGWRPVAGGPTGGPISLGGRTHRRWLIPVQVPLSMSSSQRAEVRATWEGLNAFRDDAVIRLATAGVPDGEATDLGGEWEPADLGMVWQRDPAGPDGTRWWCDEDWQNPALVLPLPARQRLRPDDVLRMRLRLVTPASNWVLSRLDLVTPGRRVFQMAADLPLTEAVQTLELRVGDATAGIWTHSTPEKADDARFVRLSFFGLNRRQRVELSDLELVTAP